MKNENTLLKQFNVGLLDMRELFHKSGRLDDSNSKLDEVTKLLCLEIASVRDPESRVPSLKEILEKHHCGHGLVSSLNAALSLAAKSETLRNYDGGSLLGPNPKFNIAESEEALARGLAQIVLQSFNGYLRGSNGSESFEFLNEAFCHFIRDNFRQNIEDAQYMTPPEVVNFMVDLGIVRLRGKRFTNSKPPIICDPSCGVGSFLAQFYRAWTVKERMSSCPILVGQDKVDKMARLSLLNLSLFGIENPKIYRGNSLVASSPLDAYSQKCDLILTNPPFGARFESSDLAFHSLEYFPFLHNYIQSRGGLIDSELLFLDRYLSLLKPGGTVLAVVPDSVISSSGLPSYLRGQLHEHWTIRSITELPAVTFAQAGTRTKTCILEVEKKKPEGKAALMGKVLSLGFEVSSKKGVPYKKAEGMNALEPLFDAMSSFTQESNSISCFKIVADSPSCVAVAPSFLTDESWTPSHYSSDRLRTLQQIEGLANDEEFEVHSLESLVNLTSKSRRGIREAKSQKCISVLHVGDFGSLNVSELIAYEPKTPGKPCEAGDILFSKINPRIPRVLVVPNMPFELTCSTEFEVMRPKSGHNPYEIMLLLLSDYAQNQIRSLTCGTSSSHNRIKTRELLSIRLAIPRTGTVKRTAYDDAVKAFETANIRLNESNTSLHETWSGLNDMLVV
ncbi:MAG: N-6 DNA methylase [candidate division Zixibacteria bacterium]|nr:N-6 DNA methylase [candidate division Zixibacteria bacterium]MBU1471877.1 N-6 DNA methylase [candidate division Zixibacteria bacterium]MBU2625573.1 N-6 DNA methylase [candidate division Zixibacteria bacterium]